MAEVVTDFKWEKSRKKRCYNQFIKLNCVKPCDIRRLNAGSHNFDITLLDVEKMKTLIMDCVAALGIVQKEMARTKQPLKLTKDGEPLTKEEQDASNKVFVASLSTMATAMILDSCDVPKQSNSLLRLLRAFPDYSKQMDGRGWLPLHWAVITDESSVSEDDVKAVYTSDPMALQRYHRNDSTFYGYTPAHLLCMQSVTQRNMSLIQYFSVCNEHAFTMSAIEPDRNEPLLYSYSALHAACQLGQPTEELLKHLLQLDSSQTKKKCSEYGYTPLGYLSKNISCSDSLVACLLEVDSSTEVVGNAIRSCLESSDYTGMLGRVEMLLKVNPEAAKYHNLSGLNMLHLAAKKGKMPSQLCIDIMQRIVAVHKDAVREVDSGGWLPVHFAAFFSNVEVIEFLLGLYPESASVVTVASYTLLDLAVNDDESTTSVMEAKVRFLCSRYPAMILQRDNEGLIPLHDAIRGRLLSAVQLLCEVGGQEQLREPVIHSTDADYEHNGELPLHYLIRWQISLPPQYSPLSTVADCLRMFLLLRAAPNLSPTKLRRLNYAERRLAMFLSFKAVTSQKKPVALKRLCSENKDLVKLVVSFL